MEQLSIVQQIEQIKEEMCDKYCRYPLEPIPEGKDEDWLFEEDRIRAIIKRPDEKYGHVTNISPTLENLQKTVGGYIEPVSFDGWVILCNENGKLEGLPVNMRLGNVDVLVGTIVVLGTEGEEFTDCPVDFKVWKKIVDRWEG